MPPKDAQELDLLPTTKVLTDLLFLSREMFISLENNFTCMRIGVTSQSKLKLDAVKNAYLSVADSVEVIGYSADSKIGEQPVNEQTLIGARNRIVDVKSRINGLDRIISIENGIFREGEEWLDKAVVIIYNTKDGKEYIEYSEAVVFPDKYVEIARQRGFNNTTVAKVMEEDGYIANRKDPQLTISGISRQVYLENTLKKLAQRIEN